MKSDRLIVLVAPEEKARIVALAKARHTSVGELVRSALSMLEESRPGVHRAPRSWSPPNGEEGAARVSAEQAAALERLADVALKTMHRADAALDQAFAEIEATKAHFAARRGKEAVSA